MKTMRILLFIACVAFVSCTKVSVKTNTTERTTTKNQAVKPQEKLVEVLLFHGTVQCETCEAIKKNSKEVVEEKFADLPGNKKVVFKIIDFSKPENKAIAEKYEIAWTSILIVNHDKGEEEVNNISQFAIQNARTNTEEYRKVLAEEISKFLK